MDLTDILNGYKSGKMSLDEAKSALCKEEGFCDLGFAKLDLDRKKRVGFPEVIFCQGKSKEHLLGILKEFSNRGAENILATRADENTYRLIQSVFEHAQYFPLAHIAVINPKKDGATTKMGKVAVVTAGTADISVAEEAAVTAEVFGNEVLRVYDVGVAGIHRLFARLDVISQANVIICVAGMEGALASVVGGLVDKPVIAVPTSVGYGASFSGVSALLTMLNSCASGVSVVNIDNGFGAGYMASTINRLCNKN